VGMVGGVRLNCGRGIAVVRDPKRAREPVMLIYEMGTPSDLRNRGRKPAEHLIVVSE
jgi:hypothetical protein